MSIFRLPKALCYELEQMFAKFWWGSRDNEPKTHWMSWKRMGRSKDQGGLGFRHLECFNLALLAKQLWRIMIQPDPLAVSILKENYCRNGDLSIACAKSSSSPLWKSLLGAKKLIEKGSRWRVGNGKQIKICHHRWFPTPNPFMVQSPLPNILAEATVQELLIQTKEGVARNGVLIEANFLLEEATTIQNIPLGRIEREDKLIWSLTEKANSQSRMLINLL